MTTEIVEYSPTEQALTQLAEKYKGVVYDVATTKGMEAAREGRAELRTLRTTLEKRRQELKAPILERGRLLDSEAKRITEAIESLEEPIDAQIRREEKRKEDERQRKLREEEERVRAEQRALDEIRNLPLTCVGKGSNYIGHVKHELWHRDLSKTFAPSALDNANEVRRVAVAQLLTMAEQALAAEAERAENERLRAQEREQAEAREREAREQREAQAHAERVAEAERRAIQAIASRPLALIGKSCVEIACAIEDVKAWLPHTEVADAARLAEALRVQDETVAKLQHMLETQDAADKAIARAEQEALDRRAREEADARAALDELMTALRENAPPLREAALDALTLLTELAPSHDVTIKLGFAIERETAVLEKLANKPNTSTKPARKRKG